MAIFERHFLIGTAFYGRRDFFPGGSFITTQWFTFVSAPIFPMWSKRVSEFQASPNAVRDPSGYYVYKIMGLNLKQVWCVYAWLTSMIGTVYLWSHFQEVLSRVLGSEDRAGQLFVLTLAMVGSLPHVLRRLAKRRRAKEWERARLGLSPPLR